MRTILISSIFFFLLLVSSSQAQLFSFESNAHVIAIDMSGSMNSTQRAEFQHHIQHIIKEKVEEKDWVFVVPIHAHTSSGNYLAVQHLNTDKGGRAARIAIKKMKEKLISDVEKNLQLPIGESKKYTDILSVFKKAQDIAQQKEVSVHLYILSDMIHDTAKLSMKDLQQLADSQALKTVHQQFLINPKAEPISVYVIQPAGIMGTYTQEKQQFIKKVWLEWFTSTNFALNHWDTQLY